MSGIIIRPASPADYDALWKILEPTLRAGETYTLPQDLSRDEALRYWFSPGHEVFVALAGSEILGTYYLRANQRGGGSHVANCGYITAPWAQGRGLAALMCRHSLDRARSRSFLGMQFNIVVSTNQRAVKLWQRMGFKIVGQLPRAFRHPTEGLVDAYVMYREL